MRQDYFFDVIAYPLADMFDLADCTQPEAHTGPQTVPDVLNPALPSDATAGHVGALEPVGGEYRKEVRATGGCCPVRLMSGWPWPCPMIGNGCSHSECKDAKPAPRQAIPTPNCIQCGKKTGGRMFCSNKCRDAFTAAGERFSKRLARTRLVGSDEQDLLPGE
jgi:hypothetical protein